MIKNIEQLVQNSANSSPNGAGKKVTHFYSCQDIRQKFGLLTQNKKLDTNKIPSFLGNNINFSKKSKMINVSNPESPSCSQLAKNKTFDKISLAKNYLPTSIQRTKCSPSKKIGILPLGHLLSVEEYEKRNKKLQQMTKQLRYCKDILQNKNIHLKKQKKQLQDLQKNFGLKDTIATNSSIRQKKKLSKIQFVFIKQIGTGKFGNVHLVMHKQTGFLCAMKIFKKCFILSSMMLKQLIQEIKLQSYLNHPNIVKIYTCFDDDNYVYLLSEYMSQGNLLEYIQSTDKISQNKAKRFLRNICEAVSQLHRNNIIHRDLKAENLVLQSGIVKICDFGWSSFSQQNMKQTCCGTPIYLAPQIILGDKYNNKVDIWAVGVLAYEMLTKQLPFSIKKQQDLMNILTKEINFPQFVSQQAKQFIRMALSKKPETRAQAEDLFKTLFLSNLKIPIVKDFFH